MAYFIKLLCYGRLVWPLEGNWFTTLLTLMRWCTTFRGKFWHWKVKPFSLKWLIDNFQNNFRLLLVVVVLTDVFLKRFYSIISWNALLWRDGEAFTSKVNMRLKHLFLVSAYVRDSHVLFHYTLLWKQVPLQISL